MKKPHSKPSKGSATRTRGMLLVRVCGARNVALAHGDRSALSVRCFVRLHADDRARDAVRARSAAVVRTRSPVWNEWLRLPLSEAQLDAVARADAAGADADADVPEVVAHMLDGDTLVGVYTHPLSALVSSSSTTTTSTGDDDGGALRFELDARALHDASAVDLKDAAAQRSASASATALFTTGSVDSTSASASTPGAAGARRAEGTLSLSGFYMPLDTDARVARALEGAHAVKGRREKEKKKKQKSDGGDGDDGGDDSARMSLNVAARLNADTTPKQLLLYKPAVGVTLALALTWVIGYFGFSLIWVVGVGAALLAFERRIVELVLLRALARERAAGDRARARDEATESADWLNTVVRTAFVNLHSFIESTIRKEVAPHLAKAPKPITNVTIERLELGNHTPQLRNIVVLDTHAAASTHLVLETDVYYHSDAHVVVSARCPFKVEVSVRELHVDARVRLTVVMEPNTPPFLRCVSVQLVDRPPAVSVSVAPLHEALDVMDFPLFSAWIRETIVATLVELLAPPNSLDLEITGSVPADEVERKQRAKQLALGMREVIARSSDNAIGAVFSGVGKGTTDGVTAIGAGTLGAVGAVGGVTVGAVGAVGKGTVDGVATVGKGTVDGVATVGKGTVDGVTTVGKGTVDGVTTVGKGTVALSRSAADGVSSISRSTGELLDDASGTLVDGVSSFGKESSRGFGRILSLGRSSPDADAGGGDAHEHHGSSSSSSSRDKKEKKDKKLVRERSSKHLRDDAGAAGADGSPSTPTQSTRNKDKKDKDDASKEKKEKKDKKDKRTLSSSNLHHEHDAAGGGGSDSDDDNVLAHAGAAMSNAGATAASSITGFGRSLVKGVSVVAPRGMSADDDAAGKDEHRKEHNHHHHHQHKDDHGKEHEHKKDGKDNKDDKQHQHRRQLSGSGLGSLGGIISSAGGSRPKSEMHSVKEKKEKKDRSARSSTPPPSSPTTSTSTGAVDSVPSQSSSTSSTSSASATSTSSTTTTPTPTPTPTPGSNNSSSTAGAGAATTAVADNVVVDTPTLVDVVDTPTLAKTKSTENNPAAVLTNSLSSFGKDIGGLFDRKK